ESNTVPQLKGVAMDPEYKSTWPVERRILQRRLRRFYRPPLHTERMTVSLYERLKHRRSLLNTRKKPLGCHATYGDVKQRDEVCAHVPLAHPSVRRTPVVLNRSTQQSG